MLNDRYYPYTLFSRAFSTPEKEWIHAHDTIRIGYLEDYLPYSGTDDAGKVTGLVNDVLDMSRIESGTIRLEESAVHLPDLLRGMFENKG